MNLNQIYYTDHFSAFEDLFKSCSKINTLRKGDLLPQEPDKEIMHYILSGAVKSYYLYDSGEEKISGIFGHGQIVPYIVCLPVQKEYIRPKMCLVSKCLTDTTLITFTRNVYMQLYDSMPELRTAAYNWLVYRHDKYEYETFYSWSSSFAKVCTFIYSNTELFTSAGALSFIITQEDVGNILGLSRIEIARSYKKLRDAGIISISRGRVILVDRDRLEILTNQSSKTPKELYFDYGITL